MRFVLRCKFVFLIWFFLTSSLPHLFVLSTFKKNVWCSIHIYEKNIFSPSPKMRGYKIVSFHILFHPVHEYIDYCLVGIFLTFFYCKLYCLNILNKNLMVIRWKVLIYWINCSIFFESLICWSWILEWNFKLFKSVCTHFLFQMPIFTSHLMCLGLRNSITHFWHYLLTYCVFSFAKLKLLVVKMLPTPRELPSHRTSFSLTEGWINCRHLCFDYYNLSTRKT